MCGELVCVMGPVRCPKDLADFERVLFRSVFFPSLYEELASFFILTALSAANFLAGGGGRAQMTHTFNKPKAVSFCLMNS